MRRLRYLPAILLAALLPFIVHAASGYKVNGTDLDSIFAPYHTGWPQAAATGFKVGGADINSRYAPLSTGSAAAATKYKTASGQDLNAIFAAIGTTGVQVATQPSAVSGSAAAGNPSGTVTSNTTSVLGIKGGGSYSYTWHIASGQAVNFTSPSTHTTGVTYSAVPAGTTYSGTMYCTISDGVTSVNTNSASWSLQNTSPATLVRTYTSPTGNYLTETVPSGYTQVTIEVWGGGGEGAASTSGAAGGGGGGGYAKKTIAVKAGDTFQYYIAYETSSVAPTQVGNNGVSSTVTGTVLGGSVNLGAFGGGEGTLSAAGAGGGGSGGDVVETGAAGTFGTPGLGGAGANGGGGGASNGADGVMPGGGSAAGYGGASGGHGAQGQVRFTYQ